MAPLVFGARAVFRTGEGPNAGVDEALVEGSPRGAQTAVQKSMARQASDRALQGDGTVELPGLEMTVFNDTPRWGRARQIYQFAGVATSATYNIVRQPTFSGLPLVDEPATHALDAADLVGLAFKDDRGAADGPSSLGSASAMARTDRLTGWAVPSVAVARGLRVLSPTLDAACCCSPCGRSSSCPASWPAVACCSPRSASDIALTPRPAAPSALEHQHRLAVRRATPQDDLSVRR